MKQSPRNAYSENPSLSGIIENDGTGSDHDEMMNCCVYIPSENPCTGTSDLFCRVCLYGNTSIANILN
jgi:hypothetical protein